MTIEHFLSYWSQHDTAIIEGLVVAIILLSLFVAYRGFFAKKDGADHGHSHDGGTAIDTAYLEKTLQKILENQGSSRSSSESQLAKFAEEEKEHDKAAAAKSATAVPASSGEGAKESSAEVTQMRMTLGENQKRIEILQMQLAEVKQKTEAAQAAPAAAGAEGLSNNEKLDFTAKIRDLEARLAEYEIISEDIADLSRYKDENDKLKSEIDGLRGGAAAPTAASTSAAAAPVVEPPPIVVAPPVVAPPPPEPTEPAVAEPVPEEPIVVAPPPAEPEISSESAQLIDDDLMKEFAAAVEGQKNLDKVGEKAVKGEAKKEGDAADELMNEFENFVKKS